MQFGKNYIQYTHTWFPKFMFLELYLKFRTSQYGQISMKTVVESYDTDKIKNPQKYGILLMGICYDICILY